LVSGFSKYQGTGNDFIMIDDRDESFLKDQQFFISHLCDRRFGIGADGLILIREHPDLDFSMVYFNADGKEGSLCGNGGRCAVAFAHKLGMCAETTRFHAIDGAHDAELVRPDHIRLQMQPVKGVSRQEDHCILDTGSPHYCVFTLGLENMNVYDSGRKIRYSSPYKEEGINVNFIQREGENLFVRTYERGVENETYSCGTGVVASAICAALNDKTDKTAFRIRTLGGELSVSFRRTDPDTFDDIILEGPAKFVFSGSLSK
jgi:diaminopimelate epimerase